MKGGTSMKIHGLVTWLSVIGLVTTVGSGLFAIDVDITAPTVELIGALSGSTAEQNALNAELENLANDLEQQLESDDLKPYSEQPLLAQGMANAGSAAAHVGTQRAFSDYTSFACTIGTGLAASGPDISLQALENAADDIEKDGDVYVGAAVQPLAVAFGWNLEKWLERTRAYAKVGYWDIPQGKIADELSFNSLTVGLGVQYKLFGSEAPPAGALLWRGVNLNSGFIFQRNRIDIEVDASEGEGFEAESITFGDIGFTDGDLSGEPIDSNTVIGTILVAPVLSASVESRTYSIPLEITTGIRALWVLDLSVGGGVDVVFGRSEVSASADGNSEFEETPEADPYINTTSGKAEVSTSTTDKPQLLRPRVSAGLGLSLGPVKIDVPLMLYFDTEGYTTMLGVTVGAAW